MAWHDKPICLNYPLEAGDIITFHAEWLPYRGDYKYLVEIEKQKDKIKKMQKEIHEIKKSHTFRIGRMNMYIPRKIKKWFECLTNCGNFLG